MSEQIYIVKCVSQEGDVKYLSSTYPTGGTFRLSKDRNRALTMYEGESSEGGWFGVPEVGVKANMKNSGITDIELIPVDHEKDWSKC